MAILQHATSIARAPFVQATDPALDFPGDEAAIDRHVWLDISAGEDAVVQKWRVNGTWHTLTFVGTGGSGSTYNYITPANVVGGTIASHVFTKTASYGWGNAGFSSSETFPADVRIKWTEISVNMGYLIGLSSSDPDQDYATEQYAFHQSEDGHIHIYESSTDIGIVGNNANGTVYEIKRLGSSLTYWLNNVQVGPTRTVSATLLVDVAVKGLVGGGGAVPVPLYLA